MEDLRKMVSSPNTLPAELPTDGFIPQLRRNCCYIVSAVIINQNKVSCCDKLHRLLGIVSWIRVIPRALKIYSGFETYKIGFVN